MTGLADVTRVLLRSELLEATHATLREIGREGVEGLVLWAGRRHGSVFAVEAVLCPNQRALRSESGLCVLVDGAEIHRINTWLYRNRMELVAQIHSHPGEAYHSALDDTIPLVTTAGGLSLVVPEFARGAVDLARYAGYRLSADGEWVEVPCEALLQLIDVEGDRT
jgi:hypothetical protein